MSIDERDERCRGSLQDDLQIKSDAAADPACRIRRVLNLLNSHSPPVHIDLSYGNLQLNSLKLIAQYLHYNKTVQVLNLKGNQIGDQGAAVLASALEHNRTVRRLDLSRNQIGHQGARHLATALSRNSTMANLDLSYNGIGAEGVRALSHAIADPGCRLRWLSVRHNAIGEDGASALGQGLQLNQTLLFLDLGANQIGAKGTRALTHALAANRSLVMLDLSRNEVGVRGAGHLAKVLGQSRVRILVLQQNAIDDQGAFALLGQHAAAIECLDLRRNPVTQQVRLWPGHGGGSTTVVLSDDDAVADSIGPGDEHTAMGSGSYRMRSWADGDEAEDFDDDEFRQKAVAVRHLSDYYQ